MISSRSFDDCIREAESWTPYGWDFYSLGERWVQGSPPWDYAARVSTRLSNVQSMLDLGTGGGELLSTLHPLPKNSYATEGYRPNGRIAKQRLDPLGVEVIETWCEENTKHPQAGCLPFKDNSLDLVIDRHESFVAEEVFRVLDRGAVFITQQMGNYANELNVELDAESPSSSMWNPAMAVHQLCNAGLEVTDAREASITGWFSDIGAVACYLKAVPWQIPDFTIKRYTPRLEKLHEKMIEERGLEVKGTPFYLEAIKN